MTQKIMNGIRVRINWPLRKVLKKKTSWEPIEYPTYFIEEIYECLRLGSILVKREYEGYSDLYKQAVYQVVYDYLTKHRCYKSGKNYTEKWYVEGCYFVNMTYNIWYKGEKQKLAKIGVELQF